MASHPQIEAERRVCRDLESWLERGDLSVCFDELATQVDFLAPIETAVSGVDEFRTKSWRDPYELGIYRVAIYCLVRLLKPVAFIETGVLHGLTSHFALQALRRNDRGTLHSIDLPSYAETGPVNRDGYDDTLPPGKEPGWAMGGFNADRWNLIKGPSLEELPPLLERLGEIDMFLHDSEHTYDTMIGEMRLAWPALKDGGVLICDNIDSSDAFADFCSEVGRMSFFVHEIDGDGQAFDEPRFGIVVK